MQKKHNNLSEELNSYFDALAQSSTEIPYDGSNGKYLSMGVEEMVQKSNLNFNSTFGLVYEPIDAKVMGRSMNDAEITAGIALWFLKFVPADDYAARQTVLDDAFRIAMNFLAKLKHDQEEYTRGNEPDPVVRAIDLSSVELNVVGPIGDQHHGYALEIALHNSGVIEYDETLWQ